MDKKTFTVAILGVGARGYTYGKLMLRSDCFKIVSLCDRNPKQLEKGSKAFDVPEENLFTDENVFFKEKRADVLVVTTYDKYHVRESITAMRLGYDLLVEKPVTDSLEELNDLLTVQKETGRNIVVCHVLRYSAPYVKLFQLLQEGVVGELFAIDAIERVRYWHFAQAYARLQSEVNDVAHPTILAKCSHDLDYIQHFAQAKCDTVSSVGALRFFRKENMPEGAAERCLDCRYKESCIYSAKKIYIDRWYAQNCPVFEWPYYKVSLKNPTTEEALYEGLKTAPLGKCVFLCGNESNEYVVDHQMVQMRFENGVIADLKMLISDDPGGRRVTLYGSHGELVFDERSQTLEIRRYAQKPEIISVSELSDDGGAHGGGDAGLVRELYDMLTGRKETRTSLEESAESHLIGIKAEQSRLHGGMTLKVHDR